MSTLYEREEGGGRRLRGCLAVLVQPRVRVLQLLPVRHVVPLHRAHLLTRQLSRDRGNFLSRSRTTAEGGGGGGRGAPAQPGDASKMKPREC